MLDASTHDNAASNDHGSNDHGHGGTGLYWRVFVALCVLTTASALTYTNIWRESIPVHVGWAFMMAVSCAKALLVITFFMHLLWEANWKWVLTIPAAFMSVFLICMLVPDVGRRTLKYSETRWEHAVSKDAPKHGSHSLDLQHDHNTPDQEHAEHGHADDAEH